MAIKLKEEHDERMRHHYHQQQQQQQHHHQSDSIEPAQQHNLREQQPQRQNRALEFDRKKESSNDLHDSNKKGKRHTETVNPRTGRVERVFVNLELVYPNADDPMAEEYCFEELRARHRGWVGRDWKGEKEWRERGQEIRQKKSCQEHQQVVTTKTVATKETVESLQVVQSTEDQAWALAEKMQVACKLDDGNGNLETNAAAVDVGGGGGGNHVTDLNDENAPPSKEELEKAALARRLRREERANRTRKIKVMEVKGATQTSKYIVSA